MPFLVPLFSLRTSEALGGLALHNLLLRPHNPCSLYLGLAYTLEEAAGWWRDEGLPRSGFFLAVSVFQVQMAKHASEQQPEANTLIPDKLYFRIGEVARLCGIEAYVLRFWESEFPQLRINKSGTGQRLYRKRDVELVLRIKRLLYSEGYTIAGARQVFATEIKEPRKKAQAELPLKKDREETPDAKLKKLRSELKEILGLLSAPPAKAKQERAASHTREARAPRQNAPSLFDR